MKMKSIVTLLLLVISIISVYLIFSCGDQRKISADQSSQSSNKITPAEEKATPQDTSAAEHIVATYFHGSKRCRTCLTIEAYTEEALKEKFAEALKSGKLVWRSVDISIPENKHFVNDYQLYTQSVILSYMQDGKQRRWKNLDKVWQLVRNKEDFFSYIQRETAQFLEQ